jgi:hypothetical protein
MKRLFFPLVMACALLLDQGALHAQPAAKKQEASDVAFVENTFSLSNNMAAFRNIPIKAVRSFKKSWQYVDNESWYPVPDGYRARFTEDGVLYLVSYNKKGNWLNTMRQYDETKLDKDVRSSVRSGYYDYSIILVEEMEVPNKPLTYVIHLEDKTSFLNIRFCDREMEVLNRINKL